MVQCLWSRSYWRSAAARAMTTREKEEVAPREAAPPVRAAPAPPEVVAAPAPPPFVKLGTLNVGIGVVGAAFVITVSGGFVAVGTGVVIAPVWEQLAVPALSRKQVSPAGQQKVSPWQGR